MTSYGVDSLGLEKSPVVGAVNIVMNCQVPSDVWNSLNS